MRLTKHHGLGNDFVVLLDAPGACLVTAELARAVCDRRRGVGADGLLWVTAGGDGLDGRDGVDATMALYNADGGRAEMSGNGIACLAQAVALAGWAPLERVIVQTDAGIRVVSGAPGTSARTQRMRVDMGAATVGDAAPEWLDDDIGAALNVDMGNPHLVLRASGTSFGTSFGTSAGGAAKMQLAERGRIINEQVPGGVNVEVVTVGPGPDELTMEVYERGVGITEACGSGACAAAVAAAAWGLTGPRVTVQMAGGSSEVALGPVVHLTTTAVYVADIDFHGGGAAGGADGGASGGAGGEPAEDTRWP